MTAPRRAFWLVAILWSVSTPSSAQTPAEVGLSVRDCWSGEAGASPELTELVRLELGADGARVLRATQPMQRGTTLFVERGCQREHAAEIVIRYVDPARGLRLERSLGLEDAPLALRERALALALAELFRAGEATEAQALEGSHAANESKPGNETSESPSSAGEAASSVVANEPVESERPPAAEGGNDTMRSSSLRSAAPSVWQVQIGPVLHVLPNSSSPLFGALLAVSWRKLTAGVLGNLGSDRDVLGEVSYRRVHGFVGYDVVSAEPAQFRFTAGFRAAIGGTFTDVVPTDAALSRNVVSASGDVALETSVRWLFSARWQTRFSVDVGYAFGPRIRADGRELAKFSGVFVGAALCLVAGFGVER